MRRAEVDAVVDEVLRETLGASGFHHATIVERPDESGRDSFYVNVHFEPQPTTIQALPVLEVLGQLRQRLLDGDEERFPYVHYVLPDDEVLGEELDTHEV